MERRHFHRVLFSAPADIHLDDQHWSTTVQDVSLRGALVATPQGMRCEQGQHIQLNIELAGFDEKIHIKGVIRHLNPDFIGVECEDLDIDSATIIKRIMELNLADEDLLHRDLQAMIDYSTH
ncbi:PilZ domain-containing protein [Aestuariibacter sp. AA17]|uniref:Cyclic diguanosine monophosphate-binding protein n=1 Tax=Fluctibacter corallii TaxID=2984329 RepID=A0ABT3A3H8_9ALTE|nr:PilZ domain-containing protein [Aestuariibacter sp. AA17]MCV2883230.1 PilZ domain-containing protein [Aestuariibacter sp. AA17]